MTPEHTTTMRATAARLVNDSSIGDGADEEALTCSPWSRLPEPALQGQGLAFAPFVTIGALPAGDIQGARHSGEIALVGRLATEADLKRGDAVFLSLVDGKPSGSPAHIKVPQFAHLIQEKGKRRSVVVVQAETSEKGTLFGVRDAQGNEYVATEPEIVLLGSSHP